MRNFSLFENEKIASFLIEKESFEGIKIIGKTVAEDIELVTGRRAEILDEISNKASENLILAATIGKSPILDRLISDGKISVNDIDGKREVFKLSLVEAPFPEYENIKKLLVVAGSDKRGTIYAMFKISELCGVSPLVFWGDAAPAKRDTLVFDFEKEIVSKEPSVKYRGFFINDEWPAFGNWCTERYGDVNAKAYEKIFELLLRLKGNYMWPAMWNSSFSEDGPGTLSAELADTLGVIMGTSHHEPLCRAGLEWQRQYKNYSDDNAWSFITNKKGIRKFWEDGVLRNKDFENVITIGMRGESDSKLLPEDATLKDNIDVVKKAIIAQDDILREQMNPDLSGIPRMLAIYKEVEDYYYGDESTEGLKDWDELKDVIFLLSDDNHGHVRALPTKDEAKHPGGFGMYYHFDYHGAPISYEWVNCNRLTKTCEQMSLAYEAGVREMWIVNVGDLKMNEYPLSFFMELAYDYEGHKDLDKIEDFIRSWIDSQFGDSATGQQKNDIFKVLTGYSIWNSTRTPETTNPMIYNPVDFMEGDRVYAEVNGILETALKLDKELKEPALTSYRSMIFYPAAASLNNVLMNVEAGMNRELAQRGCVYANHYAKSVMDRIRAVKKYVADFHAFNDGKWNHMMSSAHTGFRSWDAYNWSYPTASVVSPIHEAKAVISFRGSRQLDLGSHWQGSPALKSDAFTRPDTKQVLLDIDSRGDIGFTYEIENDCKWLICKEPTGRVEIVDNALDIIGGVASSEGASGIVNDTESSEGRKTVTFTVNRDALFGKSVAEAKVKLTFDNGAISETRLSFEADNSDISELLSNLSEDLQTPDGAVDANKADNRKIFIERQNLIVIGAENFAEKEDVEAAGFKAIAHLGKAGSSAIKVFPATENYGEEQIKSGAVPCVKYCFIAEESGIYDIEFHCTMRNPIIRGGRLNFGYAVNDGNICIAHGVDEGYFTDYQCAEWDKAVLDHEHVTTAKLELRKGLNTLSVYAGDAGFVLEKLVMHKESFELPQTYLGPVESYFI
ncbi:glycosyl hydrolase 115 family protein [Butyrivibrio sp. WCD3002]|uniref:glycosyl hydrolase 115 family protein n=1 Tax=Butyrivibrio sp. WCD3002 TaxID=1280676 RepID=UPI000413C29F|nr:glycosyl hydrolase 115 family protein [Butyrivibrio sp. WCD3002]